MSMHRRALAVPLLLFAAAAMTEDAAVPKSTAELVNAINGTLRFPDCATNVPLLTELVARPQFAMSLHVRQQGKHLTHLAMCLADAGDFDQALQHARRAAEADPESMAAQNMRLMFAMMVDAPADAVAAFDAVSRLSPEMIRLLAIDRIEQVIDAAHRSDPTGNGALKVHEAIERAGWRQAAPYFDDEIRVDHARLLIERDRLDEARQRLATVTDVRSLAVIRADRRFDPLRQDPAFEAQLDLTSGAERHVARAQAAMESNPRQLRAVYLYTSALVAANRRAEASAVAGTVIGRLRTDPAAFDDAANSQSILMTLLSSYHYAAGRFDEGRASYRKYIGELEGDWFLTTLQLAFANALVGEGRAAEALDVLSVTAAVSPLGQVWSAAIRVCANVQKNDRAAAEKSLAFVRSHAADDDRALPHALLCVNDLDALAALVIARLRDPAERPGMLESLQIGPSDAFDELPFMKTIRQREAVLRDRKDVRKAVDAVGRIETVPVVLNGLY